jgi:hypothetical protein
MKILNSVAGFVPKLLVNIYYKIFIIKTVTEFQIFISFIINNNK